MAATSVALLLTVGMLSAQEEEEAAVIVGEDEAVVTEATDGAGETGWNARAIPLRKVGDKPAFVRQSSEAFDDPDARLGLELKYYFELPAEMNPLTGAANGLLSRGSPPAAGAKLSAGAAVGSAAWTAALPLALEAAAGSDDVEWVDYQAGAKAKVIAAILPAGEKNAANPSLLVARVLPTSSGFEIEKQVAVRELKAAEMPAQASPGGLLDVWDRPKSLGSRAMFLGRVIAVLKQVENRYAVDFYGESLNAESDCRVWLWNKGSAALGMPVAVRFVEVPVKKGADTVSSVWALAVISKNDDGSQRAIAIDYPLCRPAVMAQMQKAAGANNQGGGPDLTKIVGEDLLDEFARRLVNGTYR